MPETSSHAPPQRPSPEALLELAEKEGRGKLKIFLGAAPGVGKTFAMLSGAREAKAEGADIVVGVVETHGRRETAELLEGLEILPRKPAIYRGRVLMEFDTDAALARRPKLLLVDELAHSNVPGSRHPKRYQDVEEILKAGIDVWTTLNIQHLESLSDVVARITGIVVRETVPDTVIDKADEVVVVDLTPDELIQRLKEGKVYLPESARRAIDRFFKPGNLTALRELALRRTADRVDEQMLSHLRRSAIEGPWPTADRLLVCVGGDEAAEKVVRAAGRMAAALKSGWIALHVEQTEGEGADRVKARRAEKAMRLAERLGAETERLAARDLASEILRYANRHNVTQIVIGHQRSGWFERFLGRSLPSEILSQATGIAVTVLTSGEPGRRPWRLRLPSGRSLVGGLSAAAAATAAAVLVGLGLSRLTELPNLSMVFLLAVLLIALRLGVWPAIAASLFSFLAYNFLFIEPLYTLSIARPHELLALLVFLATAVTAGTLAGRLRERTDAIGERARAAQFLYDFSRKLSGAAKRDDILWLLTSQAAAAVKGASIVLLRDGADLSIQGGWPPEDWISTTDWAAARWAFRQKEPAGRFTGTLPNARFHFRPLGPAGAPLGAMGVDPGDSGEPLPAQTERALQALLDQTALALERTRLVEESAKIQADMERERLRAALLSSISHDLRTPLASILGAVTSLRTFGGEMPDAAKADLLASIEEEARRLSRFVANLLDMTRLEAGTFDMRRDWVDVGDAVRAAIARAARSFPARKVELSVEPGVPLVRGDSQFLEQVVFNLLDNADRYSDSGTPSRVSVRHSDEGVKIGVTDEGIGIPPEALERVFEKFYRVKRGDGQGPGTGLGLAICRGLVEAMGGKISAESPVADGRGTRVTVVLPAAKPALNEGQETA